MGGARYGLLLATAATDRPAVVAPDLQVHSWELATHDVAQAANTARFPKPSGGSEALGESYAQATAGVGATGTTGAAATPATPAQGANAQPEPPG